MSQQLLKEVQDAAQRLHSLASQPVPGMDETVRITNLRRMVETIATSAAAMEQSIDRELAEASNLVRDLQQKRTEVQALARKIRSDCLGTIRRIEEALAGMRSSGSGQSAPST